MNQAFNPYGFTIVTMHLDALNGSPVITQVKCTVCYRDKVLVALGTFKIHIFVLKMLLN